VPLLRVGQPPPVAILFAGEGACATLLFSSYALLGAPNADSALKNPARKKSDGALHFVFDSWGVAGAYFCALAGVRALSAPARRPFFEIRI